MQFTDYIKCSLVFTANYCLLATYYRGKLFSSAQNLVSHEPKNYNETYTYLATNKVAMLKKFIYTELYAMHKSTKNFD